MASKPKETTDGVKLKGGNCSANGNEYIAEKGIIIVAPEDVDALLEIGCERA